MHLIVRIAGAAAAALAIGLAVAAPAASDPPAPRAIPPAPPIPVESEASEGSIGLILPLDQPVPPDLADTEWRFIEILGTAVPDTVEATLALSANGTATGQTGCNEFSGRYVLSDGSLTFANLGYTKMACAPELMTTEAAVQTALDRTSAATVTAGGELHLLASDGALLARLVPVTTPPSGAPAGE